MAFQATATAINAVAGSSGNTISTSTTTASFDGSGGIQVDTVTLADVALDVGDRYTITVVGSGSVTHTVASGETITTVREALITALNADATLNQLLSSPRPEPRRAR